MKLLVAITNYGTASERYLSRLIEEYRGMSHTVDIVVTSNVAKDFGPGIEVIVGLPTPDPWSLGFAHKRIFAERRADYDLFIYSEDDVLITERNINALSQMTLALRNDEIASFFLVESGPDGKRYFPQVRQQFHWNAGSVRNRGGYIFASFTNEHAACYVLTRDQLQRALDSGGFLVEPHEGRCDLLVAAATDPYTQCGFTDLVCISHFEDCLVAHLPNKYCGTGAVLDEDDLALQLDVLRQVDGAASLTSPIFSVETRLYHEHWSKSYYEPVQNGMLALVPGAARQVLSLGCGWGVTEARLAENGMRVKAIPLDPVIAADAQARGVEIIYGSLTAARQQLSQARFDCILMSNFLHLLPDPVGLLSSFAQLLTPEGCVIASVPNLSWLRRLSRRLRLRKHDPNPQGYAASGMHVTTAGILRQWCARAGLTVRATLYGDAESGVCPDRFSSGPAKRIRATHTYLSAMRGSNPS